MFELVAVGNDIEAAVNATEDTIKNEKVAMNDDMVLNSSSAMWMDALMKLQLLNDKSGPTTQFIESLDPGLLL